MLQICDWFDKYWHDSKIVSMLDAWRRASVREMLDVWHAAQPAYLQQSKQVFIDPDEYGGLTRYSEQPHWWPQDTVEIGHTLVCIPRQKQWAVRLAMPVLVLILLFGQQEDSVFDNIPTCIRCPESRPGFVQVSVSQCLV